MECGCGIRECVGNEDVRVGIVWKGGVEVQRVDLVRIVTVPPLLGLSSGEVKSTLQNTRCGKSWAYIIMS
jgi:hypothetical protein